MLKNDLFITNKHKPLAMILCLIVVMVLGGCATESKFDGQPKDGKMYHIQQVLEYYDSEGNPIPQYLEFWLTEDEGKCLTLDADGNILTITIDSGKNHIIYDPITLNATKSMTSLLFQVNYASMTKIYTKETYRSEGEYAHRACSFYLLEGGTDEQWIKLYVDQATGYTLLSDNENFRLKTALFEELPVDENLFDIPNDLIYTEGE